MATVKEQTKLILQHPFFKHSLEKANIGDFSGFERLFMELSLHTWEKCSLQASRTYGNCHRLNHCDIKRELRDIPPPTTLDIRLPFVQPKKENRLKSVKISHTKVRVQANNPNQLCINFEIIIEY
jgi:hypothetical protein